MKTLKVISEGEKEFGKKFPNNNSVCGCLDDKPCHWPKTQASIKSFLSHQNKQLIEAVLSDVGEFVDEKIKSGVYTVREAIDMDTTVDKVALLDMKSHLTKLKDQLTK